MFADNSSVGESIFRDEDVLAILGNAKITMNYTPIEGWLQDGSRIYSRLFDAPSRRSSEASKAQMQALKASRPKELIFLTSLSSLLLIDELTAEIVLKEYCQQQVLGSHNLTVATLELTSFITLENVRDFYYSQQQSLWKILQELLRIDKDEGHKCHSIAHKNISSLMNRDKNKNTDLLGILLSRIDTLQSWQPNVPSKSQFTSFEGSHPITANAVLDTRCSEFIGRHMLACSEFVAHELERALETLILLLYTHASLNQQQLESLIRNGSRDNYSVPRGCVQLLRALEGTVEFDAPFRVPFSVTSIGGLPTVQATYRKIGEQISFKYITIFAESLQFWRALAVQPLGSREEHKATHPLLDNYSQTDMEIFTSTLEGLVSNSLECLNSDGMNIRASILLLWSMFLEMFGNPMREETVVRPAEFKQWMSKGNYKDNNLVVSGSFGSRVDLIMEISLGAGGLEALVGVLSRVIRVGSTVSSRDVLDIQQYPQEDQMGEGEGEEVDLLLACTVLQEAVNVIILTACLSGGSIENIHSISLLIELVYRGDQDLCDTFWIQWKERGKRRSEGSNVYPLCLLVESLLRNTPHDPVYLFSILTSLACSPDTCLEVLELLNTQVSLVDWSPVGQLLFLEEDSEGEDRWLDIYAWKEGKTSFIGAVVKRAEGQHVETGMLKTLLIPQESSRGVICDISTDEKEEILVRWDDQILWYVYICI
jgi:hypothetical protein